MENLTEAQARALEPTLGNAASQASRRAVIQLARLPPALKEPLLGLYVMLDLGNLVRCALAAGASANSRFGEHDTPVLCAAAQGGSVRSLKALLTGGADVRLIDKAGNTPLHWAAWKGDTACIALLLAAGAPLEARSSNGRTPLALASTEGRYEAVALLLENGADADTANRCGNTPVIDAIAQMHTRCVELLLPHSNLSITSLQGMNAFHYSVIEASYDCFKLLLPRVTDVDVRTVPSTLPGVFEVPNQTAAHIACRKGQHKILEKLLRRGASRTARDSAQRTPLHYAAGSGQLSCIVQLIGHPEAYKMAQADINAADEDSCTPLHYAASYGHAECCGLLMAAGARLDARMIDRFTPLMVAQQKHPANTSLHDLLAGRGPARPPGTTCDRCGCAEDPTSHLMPCSGCQVARYCSIACQHAAWEAHEPQCGRLKAKREHNTGINFV